jgi:CO/xanthine dehydrogenase Mo-binding subunit
VTLSAAIHYASERLRTKVFSIAANMLECAPVDLELRDGKVGVLGVPGMEVTLAAVAQAARPGWDHGRPAGVDAGLEESFYFEPPTVTWSNATHLAVVDVDIASGGIEIERYVVAHDCGVVINPMLVEGQIVGGCAQGVGGTLLEEFLYDERGEPLSVTFADYLMPTAREVPPIEVVISEDAPSPLNPLGLKGAGEGGANAVGAAVAAAVDDALGLPGAVTELPITPQRLRQLIRRASAIGDQKH